MRDALPLVPGRECGDCTLCCSLMLLDTLEIQKHPGAACRHCKEGCSIYESRPAACRDFYCAWRQMDIFGPEWRPDKSGIFAQIETQEIPEAFGYSTAIGLMLVGNPRRTVRQKYVLEFIITGILSGIPLFLSLPGPPGHQAAKLLLNSEAMLTAAKDGKSGRVKDLLEAALNRLQAHNFKQYVMTNTGNNVSL